MTEEKYEIPVPVAAEEPVTPERQMSGMEWFRWIMTMPISYRRAHINSFPVIMGTALQVVGLIAAIILAVLLFIFLFGNDSDGPNVDRPPGSGAGDSSGGGRNDNIGDEDALGDYVPPE